MQSAYHEPLLVGFQTIYVSPDTESYGLRVICYLSTDRRDAFIVFRGTVVSNAHNLFDDFILSLQQLPLSFHRAREVDQDIRFLLPSDCRITYLGHSLGAIHASLFACLHHVSAITYDSPGIGSLVSADSELSSGALDPNTKIINFLSAPNLINTLHPQVGRSYRVYVGLNSGVHLTHVVKSMVGTLKQAASSDTLRMLLPAVSDFAGAVSHGLSRAVSAKITSVILPAASYAIWLLRQHSVDNVVKELIVAPHQFQRLGKVESWPEFNFALTSVENGDSFSQLNANAAPLEGFHTLSIEDELRILEERLRKLDGYRVLALENETLRAEEAAILNVIFSCEPVVRPMVDVSTVNFPFVHEPIVGSLEGRLTTYAQGFSEHYRIINQRRVSMKEILEEQRVSELPAADPVTDLQIEKKNAASMFLGCAIKENGSKGERTFIVSPEKVEIGAVKSWYNLKQVENLTRYDEAVSKKFSMKIASSKVGLSSDLHYQEESNRAALVMSVVHYYPVSLEANFPHLIPAPGVVGLHNLGVTYIKAGALISGFQLIIEGITSEIREEDTKFNAALDIDVCLKTIEVGIQADAGSDSSESHEAIKLNISFEGIGGYLAPTGLFELNLRELKQKLKEIHEDFSQKSRSLVGEFYYQDNDIETIEQTVQLSSANRHQKTQACKKEGPILFWNKEEQESFFVRSRAHLRPTQSIWDYPVSLRVTQQKPRYYVQIVISSLADKKRELSLVEDGGGRAWPRTKMWNPTSWEFMRHSQFPVSEGLRFLIGRDNEDCSWALSQGEDSSRISLCKTTEKLAIINPQVLDPKTNKIVASLSSVRDSVVPEDVRSYPSIISGAKITKRQIRDVDYFLKRFFPKISMANGQSLAVMLGNTGSGKSAKINSLLGHNFSSGLSFDRKSYFEVIDKNRPYAEMGDSSNSTTKEPSVFFVDPEYTGQSGALCDLPGFLDTDKEDALIAFGMFMVKEMAAEIKSVVIVIDWAELTAAKGEAFKKLIDTLKVMIHSDQLEKIRENLVFVINLKGVSLPLSPDESVEDLVFRKIQTVRDGYKEFFYKYEKILAELNKPDGPVDLKLTVWKKMIKPRLVNIGLLSEDSSESEDSSDEEIQKILLEADEKRSALDSLGMITQSNLIVWKSVHDLACSRKVWEHLNRIKKPILKSALQFGLASEGAQKYWRMFDAYVYQLLLPKLSGYQEKMETEKNKIDAVESEIRILESSLDTANERAGRLTTLKAKLATQEEKLTNLKKDLEKYKKREVSLGIQKVPETKSGWWNYAKAEVEFNPGESQITHRSIKLGDYVKKIFEGPTELSEKPQEDGSGHIQHVAHLKMTFEKEKFWWKLSADDVEIDLGTVYEHHKSHEGEISRQKNKVEKVQGKINDLKREESGLETENNVMPKEEIDRKVIARNDEIKIYKGNIEAIKCQIEAERDTYQEHYSDWQPIYELLTKALENERSSTSNYPNIKFFLDLVQKFYGFCPAQKKTETPSALRPSGKKLQPANPSIFDLTRADSIHGGGGGRKEDNPGMASESEASLSSSL